MTLKEDLEALRGQEEATRSARERAEEIRRKAAEADIERARLAQEITVAEMDARSNALAVWTAATVAPLLEQVREHYLRGGGEITSSIQVVPQGSGGLLGTLRKIVTGSNLPPGPKATVELTWLIDSTIDSRRMVERREVGVLGLFVTEDHRVGIYGGGRPSPWLGEINGEDPQELAEIEEQIVWALHNPWSIRSTHVVPYRPYRPPERLDYGGSPLS